MSINRLPNELLRECFAQLEYQNKDKISNIKSCRLVSKSFYAEASPFLINRVTISLNKTALQDLEILANHPIFSKSIKQVTINVAYYNTRLAQGRHALHRFVQDNATRLFQNLEMMERSMGHRGRREEKAQWVNTGFKLVNEWEAVSDMDYPADGSIPSPKQKILIEAWHEYVKLYEEQEEVVIKGEGIKKFVSFFEKFTTLQKIVIDDSTLPWGKFTKFRQGGDWATLFSDAGLRERCIQPSPWKGTFHTALKNEPPVYILSSLFTALAETRIRLKEFEIKITAPANMSHISFSPTQLAAIKTSLSNASKLYFRISSWARKSSLAENNDRPATELAGLCALTSAFFSSPKLTEMELSLDDYPVFGEHPTISVSNLLPLPFPHQAIEKVYFRNVPTSMADLQSLVSSLPRLQRLNCYSLYLLDGKWVDAVDTLYQLNRNGTLEYVELAYPKGREYGGHFGRWVNNAVEQGELEGFVLGRREGGNPLLGWVPEVD